MPGEIVTLHGGLPESASEALVEMARDLEVDAARRSGLGRDQLLDLFAEDYAPIRAFIDRIGASHIVVQPRLDDSTTTYPLGKGLAVDIILAEGSPADGAGAYSRTAEFIRREGREPEELRLTAAYAVRDAAGWKIHLLPPAEVYASMKIRRSSAALVMSVARRWIKAEITLEVEPDNGSIVLEMPPLERYRPPLRGFRLTRLWVDGKPASDQSGIEALRGPSGELVLLGIQARKVEVRIDYEGWFPLDASEADDVTVHLVDWMPTVPRAATQPVDVTIRHPDEERLDTPWPAEELGHGGGWRTVRYTGNANVADSLLVLQMAKGVVRRDLVVERPGIRVQLAAVEAESCSAGLERVLDGLQPLGALGNSRIVGSYLHNGFHGRHAGDLISIDSHRLERFCRAEWREAERGWGEDGAVGAVMLAHELAHRLFGAAVLISHDEASSWWEAAAEYVSTWPLTEAEAEAWRAFRLRMYVDAEPELTFGMTQRIRLRGDHRNALSYSKGLLLFTALEDRIGKEKVVAALRRFVEVKRGKQGSWSAIVDAVREIAGVADAEWLAGWLARPGAPRLRWEETAVVDGRMRGVLVQDEQPWTGRVEIGFLKGEELLAREVIAFERPRTAFDVAIPVGAERAVLDPRSRLPRLFDPKVDAEKAGLEMRIVAAH
jgi:hypothetical protein